MKSQQAVSPANSTVETFTVLESKIGESQKQNPPSIVNPRLKFNHNDDKTYKMPSVFSKY